MSLRPAPLLLASALAFLLPACATTQVATPVLAKANGSQTIGTPVGRLSVQFIPSANPKASHLVLWPSVFANASMYAPLVRELNGQFNLVLIDPPGHGASGPGPTEGFSMRDCAAAVRTILRQLGIQQAVVGGTSWGGLVAAEFALLDPAATQGVVMFNTPVFARPGLADTLIVQGMRWVGSMPIYSSNVAKSFFMPATIERSDADLAAFHAGIRQADRAAMAHAVEQVLVKRQTLHDRLPHIKAPTLFVVGQFDAMYPAGELEQAARTIPQVQFGVLPTQHISPMDEPAKSAALVRSFVQRVAAP